MAQKKWLEQISEILEGVRSKKPPIHHTTNYATVNDCANVTLAVGASLITVDDTGEVADITVISSALVLNIGTLDERAIKSMLAAGKQANKTRVPAVLGPAGVGTFELRNRTIRRILEEVKISMLRGNFFGVRSMAGLDSRTKGVDVSEEDSRGGLQATCDTAQKVSERLGCVTAVTGTIDIITDGTCTLYLKNGVPALSGVTGTDYICSSLASSFHGATGDFLSVATGGILCMSIAKELAVERVKELGNGSFCITLVDTVNCIGAETLEERVKLDET